MPSSHSRKAFQETHTLGIDDDVAAKIRELRKV